MKGLTIVGIILIVLGLLGIIFGGFSFTKENKVADVGPLELKTEETKTVPITPIASGIAVVAGIALVFAGRKK